MEMMARLKWQLSMSISRLNPFAIAAVLLASAALLAIAFGWAPEFRATQRTEAQIAELPTVTAREAQRAESVPPDQELARFKALLPTLHDIPAILATIHAAAVTHGVDLPEGQLKLVIAPDRHIAEYQMVFPFQAPYGPTRDFVRDAMTKVPTLALDQMSFQRANTGTATTDVRVEFALLIGTSDIEGKR